MEMPKEVKSKLGWLVVLTAALSVSWWSFYSLTVDTYGMPKEFGYIISTAFDGAAMVTGSLAQRYARTPDSGFGPRFATMVFVGLSAFINGTHAHILWHDRGMTTLLGIVLLSSLPVIAGWLFELEMKFLHREHQRKFGRVPQSLPALGKWAWLLHRKKAYEAINVITLDRLQKVVAKELGTRDHTFFSVERVIVTNEKTETLISRNVGSIPALLTGDKDDDKFLVNDDKGFSHVGKDASLDGGNGGWSSELEEPSRQADNGDNSHDRHSGDVRTPDQEGMCALCGVPGSQVDTSSCRHVEVLSSVTNHEEAVRFAIRFVGTDNGSDTVRWLKSHGYRASDSTIYRARTTVMKTRGLKVVNSPE